MSWLNEGAPGHEGYLSAFFADGARAAGSCATGIYVPDPGNDGCAPEVVRSEAEVTGWQLRCDHYVDGRFTGTWDGPRWVRVTNPAEHHPAERWIFCADEDAADPDEADAVLEAAVLAEWHAHLAPTQARSALRAAYRAAVEAQAELDMAVVAARLADVSWADVGADTRMSRQSAHGRWAAFTNDRRP